MFLRRLCSLLLCLLTVAAPLQATWSIVVINRKTGEVAVAVATCLENFNLRSAVPVIVPEWGAAAAQCFVDSSGVNKTLIHGQLQLGTDPVDILAMLESQDNSHHLRQYGIVDIAGRAITHTGSACGEYKGALTGEAGDLVYAIQGNVLTGSPVLLQAELALLNTPGDLSQKLMAAMEAARDMGGDGRCSCSPSDPPGCGSPPANFTKSAHIANMIVARPGDPLKNCTQANGCARGSFYLMINLNGLNAGDPDPVDLLRQEYDLWRASQIGRPDAQRSLVMPSTQVVTPGSADSYFIDLDLHDVDGHALTSGGAVLALEHDARSAGLSSLLNIQDHQDGTYTLELQPGAKAGRDLLRIRVHDGISDVTLWPPVEILHAPASPLPWNDEEAISDLMPGQVNAQAFLLGDGLTAYFLSDAQGGTAPLLRATRPQTDAAFGPAVAVPVDNADQFQFGDFWMSDDELEWIPCGFRQGSSIEEIFHSRRNSVNDPFPTPEVIASLHSGLWEGGPWVRANGLEILFHSGRSGSFDLYRAIRPRTDGYWLPPEPLGTDSGADELYPMWAEGDTRVYFSRRESGQTPAFPWMADLVAPGQFGPAKPVPGAIHAGNRFLFLTSEDPAQNQIWLTEAGTQTLPLRATAAADSLIASATELSAAAGGVVDFSLDAGPAWAGAPYFLLGSLDPDGIGLSQGNVVMPLARDWFTDWLFGQSGNPLVQGFRGSLDGQGAGQARLDLAPGLVGNPSLIGSTFWFSFLVLQGDEGFASQAVGVELKP
ncbi:MAG: DUF1028 domain-containing protein [Planctomycetota bacterium]|nr:MAG: DUF1028 domain-containing protein [Planctomycetota bacterium]